MCPRKKSESITYALLPRIPQFIPQANKITNDRQHYGHWHRKVSKASIISMNASKTTLKFDQKISSIC